MACRGGHKEIMDLLILKGADITRGFIGACVGNKIDIINLIISKYIISSTDSAEYGLMGACEGGHVELAQDFLDKLYYNKIKLIDKDRLNKLLISCLNDACWNGHIEVVKLLLSIDLLDKIDTTTAYNKVHYILKIKNMIKNNYAVIKKLLEDYKEPKRTDNCIGC